MNCRDIFSFLAEVQINDISFTHSLVMVVIFLSLLGFCGYMIVRFCKRGGIKSYATKDETKKIKIIDYKILYGRKYIALIECCGRYILILIGREGASKLSEWEMGKHELD